MRVRPTRKSVCTVAAIALAAAIAACSTATKGATGVGNTGLTQGDSVNLAGTFALASFTGQVVDSSDGATIVLTKTTYNIQSTGLFDCMLGTDSGTYVAIDTSSASGKVAGTLVLHSLINVADSTVAVFVLSSDSLYVNVSNNGSTTNTVWVK